MGGKRTKEEEQSQDVYRRLAARGISHRDYGTIKKIVAFDLPQWRLFFSRQFEHHTIEQVLRKIDQWRAFLAKDFLLLSNQRAELEKWIGWAEFLALQTIIEANGPEVDPWTLAFTHVATGEGPSGKVYRFPALLITAFNGETKETRKATISGKALHDTSRCGRGYRRAFQDLGIWDLLWKGAGGEGLTSARKPQGWPIFTHFVIPQLYEYLIPYYKGKRHYSEKLDSRGQARSARFPTALFQDMLDILLTEHPHVFGHTTTLHIKSIIQKYLDRKARSTKPMI